MQLTQILSDHPWMFPLLLLAGGAVVCLGVVAACGVLLYTGMSEKINEVSQRPHLD